ncbi:hypothetical protein VE04_10008 [Pseudogymnoascus sp. 24MN13]|nr:hypothetical protein VE04_10008 [Pseudogymnoascus sp. 24MN13]
MPELEDITYSRDECVAAVRDYYDFLSKMYHDESDVLIPPDGGWPTITQDNLRGLGKTDEVISLLRSLPYIRAPEHTVLKLQSAPLCQFADWRQDSHNVSISASNCEVLKHCSESAWLLEDIPPHVVSLTSGNYDNPVLLLDTELGVAYWPGCPAKVNRARGREAGRGRAAWAIPDFFEVFKDQFRKLNFVPISPRLVMDDYTPATGDDDGMVPMVQDIYREHGWPDLQRYRKRECLEAVRAALKERYPDFSSDPMEED